MKKDYHSIIIQSYSTSLIFPQFLLQIIIHNELQTVLNS